MKTVLTGDQVKDESRNHIDDGDRQQRGEPTPSEAVYAFAAWLTTRKHAVTLGSTQGAAIVAELVSLFVDSQGWDQPRNDYTDYLRAYPIEAPQPADPAQEPSDEDLLDMWYEITGSGKSDEALEFAYALLDRYGSSRHEH